MSYRPTAGCLTRKWALAGLLATRVSLVLAAQGPDDQSWSIGPVPEWVDPQIAETDPTVGHDGQTYRQLLFDTQCNALGEAVQTYNHWAKLFVNEIDLQEATQLSFEFDPHFQQIVLHFVKLARRGSTIDCLKRENIRVLQREANLTERLYNGRLSLNLVLDDVQKGDILEAAYTRVGQNPVFDGRFMEEVVLHGSQGTLRSRYRLLWPDGRSLYKKEHGEWAFRPQVVQHDGWREILWQERLLPEPTYETNTPGWYDVIPWVQLSEFASWAEVVDWGCQQYVRPQELSRELQMRIGQIRMSNLADDDQALAAFRFVKDEIRYLGFEIGPGAYAPRSPDEVFRSRFGDCKDKAYLLTTMLQELGIDAAPALVSSWSRRHVSDWHPSPLAFDHVIVRARVSDFLRSEPEEYWLDPTELYAHGTLEEMGRVDYERALVLEEGTIDLQDIETSEDQQPPLDIRLTFDVGKPGATTRMSVATVYSGRMANSQRSMLRSSSSEVIGDQYLDYYSMWFDSVEATAELLIEEDEEENRISVFEEYAIKDFWQHDEETGVLSAFFLPFELYDRIPVVSSQERSTPFAVVHPRRLRYNIAARLEGGWQFDPEHVESVGPASRLVHDVRVQDDVLLLSYEYWTLADHVPPEEWGKEVEHLGEIRDVLWQFVEFDGGAASATGLAVFEDHHNWNWPLLLLGGLASFGWALLMVRIWRRQDRLPTPDVEPRPIGGWLIFVAIGVYLAPLNIVWTFGQDLWVYATPRWTELTVPGSAAYHAMWAPFLLFLLVGNLGMLAACLLLLVAFTKKKKFFPRTYVWILCLSWLFSAMEPLVMPLMGWQWGTDLGFIAMRGVFVVIWASYMIRSERVRETFVR